MLLAVPLPSPAPAIDDGSEARRTKGDHCTRATTPAEEERAEAIWQRLDKGSAAWKELRELGRGGCEALAEWLRDGAGSARQRDVFEARLFLLGRGTGSLFAEGLEAIPMAVAEDEWEEVVSVLARRRPDLGPDASMALARATDFDVQDEILELLIPNPSERKGRVDPASRHHVAAVRAMLWRGDDPPPVKLAAEVADTILDASEKTPEVAAPWASLLVDLVALGEERAYDDAAGDAAKVLASHGLPGLGEAVDVALTTGNPFVQEELVDAMRDSLLWGRGERRLLGEVEKLAEDGATRRVRALARAVLRFHG